MKLEKTKVLNVRQLYPNKNHLSTGGRWKWEPMGSGVWSRAGKAWGEASRNERHLHRQCENCYRRNSQDSMRVTIFTTPNNEGFKAWTGLLCNQQSFQWVVGLWHQLSHKTFNLLSVPTRCAGEMEAWNCGSGQTMTGLIWGSSQERESISTQHCLDGQEPKVGYCRKVRQKNQYNDSWWYSYTINQCLTQIVIREAFPGGWWNRCRDPRSSIRWRESPKWRSPNEALGTLWMIGKNCRRRRAGGH